MIPLLAQVPEFPLVENIFQLIAILAICAMQAYTLYLQHSAKKSTDGLHEMWNHRFNTTIAAAREGLHELWSSHTSAVTAAAIAAAREEGLEEGRTQARRAQLQAALAAQATTEANTSTVDPQPTKEP